MSKTEKTSTEINSGGKRSLKNKLNAERGRADRMYVSLSNATEALGNVRYELAVARELNQELNDKLQNVQKVLDLLNDINVHVTRLEGRIDDHDQRLGDGVGL
jgi:hypothetical protein